MRKVLNKTRFWIYDNEDGTYKLSGLKGGPAIIHANGDKEWYSKGSRHNANGPAVQKADGTVEYYLKGKPLSREKWSEERIKTPNKNKPEPKIQSSRTTYKTIKALKNDLGDDIPRVHIKGQAGNYFYSPEGN